MIRFRNIRIFPVLCAATSLFSAFVAEIEGEEWEVVHHPRVVLFYPPDWTIRKEIPGALIEVSAPLSGPDDTFKERLLLGVEKLPKGRTFDSFVDHSVAALRERLKEVVILRDEPAQRGPHSGRTIELSHRISGQETFLELFFFEQDGDAFVVTQSGRPPDYENTKTIFYQIITGIHPLKEVFENAYFHRDFVVQIPEDWTVKEGMPGTVVAAISPKTSNSDPFRERLTVGYEKIPEGMSFKEYADRNFDVLLTRLRRVRELDRGTPLIGGEQARELELSHESTGPRTVLRVIMVPSGDRVFTLISAGMEPDYSRMKETFGKILNSFAHPTPPGNDSNTQ